MSDLKKICVEVYQKTIKDADIDTELKRALKTHERAPAFIQNLVKEFRACQFPVKRETIEQAVRDMTQLFIGGVMEMHRQKMISVLALSMEKKKKQDAEDFKKEVEEYESRGSIETFKTAKGETETLTTKV